MHWGKFLWPDHGETPLLLINLLNTLRTRLFEGPLLNGDNGKSIDIRLP
jgi:hypothetical protein